MKAHVFEKMAESTDVKAAEEVEEIMIIISDDDDDVDADDDEVIDKKKRQRTEGPSYVLHTNAGEHVQKRHRLKADLRAVDRELCQAKYRCDADAESTLDARRIALEAEIDAISLRIAYRRNALSYAATALSRGHDPMQMFERSFADIYSPDELTAILHEAQAKRGKRTGPRV